MAPIESFPSNSREPRRPAPAEKPEKKVERVTESDAVRRKKPLGKKLKETFVGGDTKSVWEYVLLDVMVPAAKDMLADAASQGVERMIFGESRSSTRRSYGREPWSPSNRVSYNRYSSSSSSATSNPVGRASGREEGISRRARAIHDFDEIILPTRVEAEEVIERLAFLLEKYESATVADLYDLVGITGNYTDDKYGWTDLRDSGVQRIRQGYLLNLPKPIPLD